MFSQHSLNRPMQGKIVLISFTDCCRFASPAASQLLNLFHVRSGENKCRLRRRLFSFLATKRKHPAERLPGAGIYAHLKETSTFHTLNGCFEINT